VIAIPVAAKIAAAADLSATAVADNKQIPRVFPGGLL